MLRRLHVIFLMVFFFTVLFASVAHAGSYTLNILDESYTFDTGNGADGDVVLRLKPGDPSRAELVVNGVVKTTTTATATIKKNVLERNGEPLNQRSDVTVKVFNIENIVSHLPVNKAYSPSNDTPGSGSMPNFNNLTIESGVMLRAASQPLHFKVKGWLEVNGYMMTEHGAGGAAGDYTSGYHGYPGGSAKNIIILAGNVVVRSNAAVFGGFGGGGGGASWSGCSGGSGGSGGSITIYTGSSFSNSGEIHGGAGGGGGVGLDDGYGYGGGGAAGSGGNVLVVTNSFTNSGKIMSGLGGGVGQSFYNTYPALAGYGGGGNRQGAGGSGGNPGGSHYGPPDYPQSGAGFGVEGTSSVYPSAAAHGLLRVLVSGSCTNSGRYGIGYSSMQEYYSFMPYTDTDPRRLLEVKTNLNLGAFDLAAVLTHFTSGVTYSFPNASMVLLQNFNHGDWRMGLVAKNVLVRDSFSLARFSSLRAGDRDVTDTVTLEGPVFSDEQGPFYLYLDARSLIKVPSSLKKTDNGHYRINGEWYIPTSPQIFNGSPISASPDATGMLAVDLTSYNNAYYNAYYGMGSSMTAVLLRSEDNGATWEELMPVDIVFANGATPRLVDLKTKVNTATLYKVKYKKAGSPYGYLMHDVVAAGYTTAAPLAEARDAAADAKTAAEAAASAAASARDVATEARNAVVDANGNVLAAARSANAQATAAADRTLYNGQSAAYWAYLASQGGVDVTPPVIEKLRGKNGATATTTGTFEVEVTARDDRTGQLQARARVDNGAWTGWYSVPQNRVPVTISNTGAHTITVEVKDPAGNTSQATMTAFRL